MPSTTIDETTALAELAALEQAVIDGDAVTTAQLSEARERVALARLAAHGREQRAQAAQEQEGAERRAQAKRDAAELLADTDAPFTEAIAAFTDALSALLRVAVEHDKRVREAARILDEAHVPTPDTQAADPLDVAGLDRSNHALWDYGTLRSVTVDGREHLLRNNPRRLALQAMNDAMRAHNLPVIDLTELK